MNILDHLRFSIAITLEISGKLSIYCYIINNTLEKQLNIEDSLPKRLEYLVRFKI